MKLVLRLIYKWVRFSLRHILSSNEEMIRNAQFKRNLQAGGIWPVWQLSGAP